MNILTPTDEGIKLAAQALANGQLVVVPTETVYGLAANALDERAVERIFIAKGRPTAHPLISHIGSFEQLATVVRGWNALAERLARRFWPGPLTMVLPRATGLPLIVTGGRETAAVRMPGHEVFRRVIELAGVPVSAPSANPFTAISPTRVGHLSHEILQASSYVLDAGPCEYGIESTVIDLSEGTPLLLRPGAISADQIEEELGQQLKRGELGMAPGSHPKHYSPTTKVLIVDHADNRPGLVLGEAKGHAQISMPNDPKQYAAKLYNALHVLDSLELREIVVEAPPNTRDWEAVWDRLRRSSSGA